MRRATMKLLISVEYSPESRESADVILKNLTKLGHAIHTAVVQEAMTNLPLEGVGYIVADDGNKEVVIESVF